MPADRDLIAEGRQLWDAATPGRWTVHDMGSSDHTMHGDDFTSENDVGWWWVWQESALPEYGGVLEATHERVSDNDPPGSPIGLSAITDHADGHRERADAELITWMRNNLPVLLDELEAAQRPPLGHLVAIHHDDSTPPEPEIVYRDKPEAQRDARWRRSIQGDDWRVYEVREVQP